MSLHDQVVGGASGSLSTGQASSLGRAALDLLDSPQVGGIHGLASLLEQNGLGRVVASWIGTGTNLPISGEQLKETLGPGTVAALAKKVGLSPDQVQDGLSHLLPGMIDRLTPGGQVARGQNLVQAGMNALRSILGGSPPEPKEAS
jgi:uncharacterized protein YidB (DUF937 family)